MPNVVLDATVLVSAFLTRGGVSDELLRHAREGAFLVFLSEAIFAEVEHTLAYPRIRRRYPSTDEDVRAFCEGLRTATSLVTDLPDTTAVPRDPNDDMVIATARAARASYLITRDRDLLILQTYEDITILTPEAFMATLRTRRRDADEEPPPS